MGRQRKPPRHRSLPTLGTPVPRAFSGARLRDERLLAGFTAAQLAQHVGRTKSAVLKYEAGAAQPPITVADALADALGLPLERFLADDRRAVA